MRTGLTLEPRMQQADAAQPSHWGQLSSFVLEVRPCRHQWPDSLQSERGERASVQPTWVTALAHACMHMMV